MKRPATQARHLLIEAHNVVIAEIVRQASKILLAPNAAKAFYIGMGVYGFDNADGLDIDRAYMDPIHSLFAEFDQELKLSGNSMRIRVDGRRIVKEW